jgi:hypothetical protein
LPLRVRVRVDVTASPFVGGGRARARQSTSLPVLLPELLHFESRFKDSSGIYFEIYEPWIRHRGSQRIGTLRPESHLETEPVAGRGSSGLPPLTPFDCKRTLLRGLWGSVRFQTANAARDLPLEAFHDIAPGQRYMHLYINTCIYAYMHSCMHICIHACIYTYIHTFIHAYI